MSAMPEYKSTITDEVNVTPSAQEKLIELLNAEEEVNGVRIFVSGGGCGGMTYGMTFAEAPTQFDSILEKDGLTMYVDAVALSYLKGVEIDYVEQGLGASFVFRNVFAATGGSGTCSACGAAGGGCA
ncbi:MAG: [Fe-S]-binding protein [Gammaproteobacteria bacterium SG8_11]|nr:MAG: [Fe-S]-binding protein [Gammaproteobacteria bacterium SG8_11]